MRKSANIKEKIAVWLRETRPWWLQYFKSVFLTMSIVTIWLVFLNPVTYSYCFKTLCHLFCHCLSTYNLPASEWRTHCVVPVYKSGDKSNVANYRPISLLCVASKVLERLIYNHVIGHLIHQVHLHPASTEFGSEFGFIMAGRSSLQQLYCMSGFHFRLKIRIWIVY